MRNRQTVFQRVLPFCNLANNMCRLPLLHSLASTFYGLSFCYSRPSGCEGFTGGSVIKESACQCRRHRRCRFDPWIGKILWRRKGQPTSVFLSGKSHGQSSLTGYNPWGRRVGHDWAFSGYEVVSQCGLDLHPLMTNDFGHLFTCWLPNLYIFFRKFFLACLNSLLVF